MILINHLCGEHLSRQFATSKQITFRLVTFLQGNFMNELMKMSLKILCSPGLQSETVTIQCWQFCTMFKVTGKVSFPQ